MTRKTRIHVRVLIYRTWAIGSRQGKLRVPLREFGIVSLLGAQHTVPTQFVVISLHTCADDFTVCFICIEISLKCVWINVK